MKSINIWKYGFNWGSIVGAAYFVVLIIGGYSGLDKNFFFKFLTSLVVILGLSWSMINYKRAILKQNISFGKAFMIGLVMSFVISFFFLLYWLFYTTKINPNFFTELLDNIQKVYDSAGVNIDLDENESLSSLMQVILYPSIYIGDFIGNIFYSLILAFVVSSQKTVIPPRFNNNDYNPYREGGIDKNEESTDESNKDKEE